MSPGPASLRPVQVVQNAYVVRDLERSCQRLHALYRIGPFLRTGPRTLLNARYPGAPVRAPITLNVAFAQAGTVNVELIQPSFIRITRICTSIMTKWTGRRGIGTVRISSSTLARIQPHARCGQRGAAPLRTGVEPFDADTAAWRRADRMSSRLTVLDLPADCGQIMPPTGNPGGQTVARPKVPLISRRKALEAALEIVDNEGLAALSIRRLGEALNVNGASLYHHFENKEDILVGVTQLALADVTSPRSEHDNWRVWLPLNTYRTRQALIAHPGLIPVMLRRASLGIGVKEVEASIRRLEEEGVPIEAVVPLMESLELLAIVSALQQVGRRGGWEHEDAAPSTITTIKRAEHARALTGEDLFETLCTSVMASVETAVQLKQARKARAQRPSSPASRKPVSEVS